MKKKHLSMLVAVALAGLAGAAHAGFEVEDPAARAKRAEAPRIAEALAPSGGRLAQVGVAAGQQPTARGIATGVALTTALKQIVPQGWRAKKSGAVDVAQKVSWRGDGRPWIEVLHDLAADSNVNILVDWNAKEVTVAPGSGSGLGSGALASQPSEMSFKRSAPSTEGLRQIAVIESIAKPPAAAPAKHSWTLVPTLTLRENIEAWAKEAGWEVSWAASNYPVSARVVLSGAFDDASEGPLFQLAKAYESAEQPLTFRFFTNNVLRVENASYKQLATPDPMPNPRAMQ